MDHRILINRNYNIYLPRGWNSKRGCIVTPTNYEEEGDLGRKYIYCKKFYGKPASFGIFSDLGSDANTQFLTDRIINWRENSIKINRPSGYKTTGARKLCSLLESTAKLPDLLVITPSEIISNWKDIRKAQIGDKTHYNYITKYNGYDSNTSSRLNEVRHSDIEAPNSWGEALESSDEWAWGLRSFGLHPLSPDR